MLNLHQQELKLGNFKPKVSTSSVGVQTIQSSNIGGMKRKYLWKEYSNKKPKQIESDSTTIQVSATPEEVGLYFF